MFQDNQFTSVPVLKPYLTASTLPNTDVVGYSLGPKFLQNPFDGLDYQIWRVRLINYDVSLTAPNTPEYLLYSARGITAVAISFDQNARLLLLYIIAEELFLYWHDPVVQSYRHTLLDTGVTSARITLDDVRRSQIPFSEVVIGYVKNNNLYARNQKDRYGVPYLLQEGVAGRIIKIGMSRGLRLQFLFEQNPFPVYEDPWPYGAI